MYTCTVQGHIPFTFDPICPEHYDLHVHLYKNVCVMNYVLFTLAERLTGKEGYL